MLQFSYSRLYLGIETVSCRLLQWITKMDLDLNLTEFGQLFKILMLSSWRNPIKLLQKEQLCELFCDKEHNEASPDVYFLEYGKKALSQISCS